MSLKKLIDLPDLGDQRGGLVAIEANRHIPFEIKRIYYIFSASKDAFPIAACTIPVLSTLKSILPALTS